MTGRPLDSEAAPHLFTYIGQVSGDDPLGVLETQFEESLAMFAEISEERSLRRYAPDKWSIRQLLNHVTDTERIFAYRMLWFARGLEAPLPGFDQEIAAAGAEADAVAWESHVEEFRQVRLSTISLLRNMPPEGWMRGGVANGSLITVRALAYAIPGHAAHHFTLLRERYLNSGR